MVSALTLLIGYVLVCWLAAFVFGMLTARYEIPREQRTQASWRARIKRRMYESAFLLTSISLITIMWVISAALIERAGFGPAGWNTLTFWGIATLTYIVWIHVMLFGFSIGLKRRLSRDWIIS